MTRNRPGRRRLEVLGLAHERPSKTQSPREEDYVEIIYELLREKGYAKPVDIANYLHVSPSSATKMIRRLHTEELLVHERYRGVKLTGKGELMARSIHERHELLSDFLRLLGVEERVAQKDTEGLEHFVHPETIERLTRFVKFVKGNPSWFRLFEEYAAKTGQKRSLQSR